MLYHLRILAPAFAATGGIDYKLVMSVTSKRGHSNYPLHAPLPAVTTECFSQSRQRMQAQTAQTPTPVFDNVSKIMASYEDRDAVEFTSAAGRQMSSEQADLADNSLSHNFVSQLSYSQATAEMYNSTPVSMYSHMQSTVPDPVESFNKAPTHYHMPGGGVLEKTKYLYHRCQLVHPSRHYATKAAALIPPLTPQFDESEIPCPQGVQGNDCDLYRLWLGNCQKYGFLNCDEQLQGIQSGKKTLSQVFIEQEEEIRRHAVLHSKTVSMPATSSSSRMFHTSAKVLCNVGPEAPADSKLSSRQKLQRAVKDYGSTVIVFHIGISLMSLGGFYLAVSSGLDVPAALRWLGVSEEYVTSSLASGASTFVLAYAIHKVFAPVRIGITLTSTPLIVRYMRRVGFLKPPKV